MPVPLKDHLIVHTVLGIVYYIIGIIAICFYSRLRVSIPSHTKKAQFNYIKSRRFYLCLLEVLVLGKSTFGK